jgi:hypothetical protein
VLKGKFTFAGKEAEPNLYSINIKDVNGGIPLMLENASVQIIGKASEIWNSTISGSPLAVEYQNYSEQYSNPARVELVANTNKSQEYRVKGDSVTAQRYL